MDSSPETKHGTERSSAGLRMFVPVTPSGTSAGGAAVHPEGRHPRRNGSSGVALQTGARLTSRGAPETRQLTFSFIALTDAAPIIVAHARGLFKEVELETTLRRESSWTALRDSLGSGTAQAAQMLYSMPLAGACGLLGTEQEPLIIPWVINRNGQGITLKKAYERQVFEKADALRKAAVEGRDTGRPLVFGHTLRIGTHALWLRYWLAAGGIDPNNDVALITVPPPQMVKNMRTAAMDGFCVGEPWNVRAIAKEVGFTAITSQEIWPDHPEKVCAFTEKFARQNPRSVVAVLKALHRAGEWLEDPANHADAAALLSRPEYLNCDASWILGRLGNEIAYGDGRVRSLGHRLGFAGGSTNRPETSHALWFLSQLRRWGLHFGPPDYHQICSRVIRPEFYEQALLELNVREAPAGGPPEALIDGGLFDSADPEAYARRFAIANLQG